MNNLSIFSKWKVPSFQEPQLYSNPYYYKPNPIECFNCPSCKISNLKTPSVHFVAFISCSAHSLGDFLFFFNVWPLNMRLLIVFLVTLNLLYCDKLLKLDLLCWMLPSRVPGIAAVSFTWGVNIHINHSSPLPPTLLPAKRREDTRNTTLGPASGRPDTHSQTHIRLDALIAFRGTSGTLTYGSLKAS